MRRVNNAQVIEAWAMGRRATNHSGTLKTDGKCLYSHGLVIGTTELDNGGNCQKILFDYRGTTHKHVSLHVSLALREADEVVPPAERQSISIDC